jgi:hypothetical protein
MLRIFPLIFTLFLYKSLDAQLEKSYEYEFDGEIINLSNKGYSIYVQKKNGLYNIVDSNFFNSGKINSFCVSPLGGEILIIERKKILLFEVSNSSVIAEEKFEIPDEIKKVISDTYGTKYYVLTHGGKVYEVNRKLNIEEVKNSGSIKDIAWSKNLSSLHAVSGNTVSILKKNVFESVKIFDGEISVIDISDNSFEIILGDGIGNIIILNQDLKVKKNIATPFKTPIFSIVSHQDDPHLFISSESGDLFSLNKLSNKFIEINTKSDNGSILKPIFSKTLLKTNEFILSFSSSNKLIIWNAENVEPNYEAFIEDRLNNFKSSFFKIKPNENQAEFLNRTNSDLASKIFELEEQKLIDSIARTKVESNAIINIIKGGIEVEIPPFEKVIIYTSKNILASYLKLRQVNYEVNEFNGFNIKNLKLEDEIHKSSFVFDPVMDQKKRDSLIRAKEIQLIKEKEAIALAQEISRQELQLKNSLSSIVQSLKSQGKINEVDLSVDSRLLKEKDSTGKEELNLKINFISKGVKAEVGGKTSDYPPGKYNLFDSPSAKTLVDFFINSTKENLYEYLNDGTRVTFKLTGSTDSSKIGNSLPYEDDFGTFKNFPYYFQGSLNGMQLNSEKGITNNSQLGFLRTFSVRDFITNYTDLFDATKNKFIHYSEEANKVGSEYRRIQIEMTIHSIDKLIGLKKVNKSSLSDVDIDIPSGQKKISGYALIIGNEDYASYQSDLDTSQNVPFAAQDAESVKNYLNLMYGMPKENIIMLANASYGEMSQSIAKFKKLMEYDGSGNNFVFYYSGHGMPHEQTNDPYLMPVDISGYVVDQAISLNGLLKDFKSYDYKKLTLILDACFSGVSRSPEPLIKVKGVGNKKIRDKVKQRSTNNTKNFDFKYFVKKVNSNLPYDNPNIGSKMLLISSSSGEETSLTDTKNQHGLFTYYLLKYLKESKGLIKVEELFNKLRKKVGVESILKFNKPQTPEMVFGDGIDVKNQNFFE